jgi:hypothetical protein
MAEPGTVIRHCVAFRLVVQAAPSLDRLPVRREPQRRREPAAAERMPLVRTSGAAITEMGEDVTVQEIHWGPHGVTFAFAPELEVMQVPVPAAAKPPPVSMLTPVSPLSEGTGPKTPVNPCLIRVVGPPGRELTRGIRGSSGRRRGRTGEAPCRPWARHAATAAWNAGLEPRVRRHQCTKRRLQQLLDDLDETPGECAECRRSAYNTSVRRSVTDRLGRMPR